MESNELIHFVLLQNHFCCLLWYTRKTVHTNQTAIAFLIFPLYSLLQVITNIFSNGKWVIIGRGMDQIFDNLIFSRYLHNKCVNILCEASLIISRALELYIFLFMNTISCIQVRQQCISNVLNLVPHKCLYNDG